MASELSALELARLVEAPLEDIELWRSRGLIGHGNEGAFDPEALERARLVQRLLRRGIALEDIVKADSEAGLFARCLGLMFPGGVGATRTLAEAAVMIGMPAATLRRFWQVIGLADQGEMLYDEDVRAMKGLKTALDVGMPEEAMLELARVCTDAFGRVAEAEARLFHIHIHDRLKREGLSGTALSEIDRTSTDRVMPIIEPAILYFHHKGWQRALREDAVLHVREHAGLLEQPPVPGQLNAAIVFIDLSGFTSLAEAMGDEMAARVLDRFSQVVRDAVGRFDGRVVKQIGDAFMLVFPDPGPAVACALEIDRAISAEAHFPAARAGIHFGPLLYREGDYLGTSVNIAARLATEAARHQVLVSASVRAAARGFPDHEFVPLGKRRLRGMADEVELFACVPRHDVAVARRLVDPVCGMELAAEEAAATLSIEGSKRVFCSQQCLQKFVAAPERYAVGTAGS